MAKYSESPGFSGVCPYHRGMPTIQGSGLEGSTVLAYTIIVAVALAYS